MPEACARIIAHAGIVRRLYVRRVRTAFQKGTFILVCMPQAVRISC